MNSANVSCNSNSRKYDCHSWELEILNIGTWKWDILAETETWISCGSQWAGPKNAGVPLQKTHPHQ